MVAAWDRSTTAVARGEKPTSRSVPDLLFASCSHSLQFPHTPDFSRLGRVCRPWEFFIFFLSFFVSFDLCSLTLLLLQAVYFPSAKMCSP